MGGLAIGRGNHVDAAGNGVAHGPNMPFALGARHNWSIGLESMTHDANVCCDSSASGERGAGSVADEGA
jgi:hypothetical protein